MARGKLVAVVAEEGLRLTDPDWSGELAIVLQTLGRGAELVELLAPMATPTPWLRAAAAVAKGDFVQAAELHAEIGSRPDEAFARLRAAQQLVAGEQQALAFYREVRASAYLREAEALLAASA